MELIKLTPPMERELGYPEEITAERIGYLNYTKNYYLLEDDSGSYITKEPATFIQMNISFKGKSYSIYILKDATAERVLAKQRKPKPTPVKKTPIKETPIKETPVNETPKKEEPKKPSTKKEDEKNE